MQTPIYKCPDCGAKAIYNEKRNSWKCARCGQEFSEYDVFIQGLEEWKAEVASRVESAKPKPQPQISENTVQQEEPKPKMEPKPKVEYIPSDDYTQKKNEKRDAFLDDCDSLIKTLGKVRSALFIFYIVEAIFLAVLFYKKVGDIPSTIFFTPVALCVSFVILHNIPESIRTKIRNKAVKLFDEIKSVSDKGVICGGKFCKIYFSIDGVKEGSSSVNYRCFVNNQYLNISDILLGYWTEGKSRIFEVLETGLGLMKSHKLTNWYFMMIYKDGFQAAPNKHTFSCKDYLGDDDFSDFRVRVSDVRALSEWKINNLKSVLKIIDDLLGGIPFAIAIENRSVKIMFLANRSTFVPESDDNYDKDTVSAQFSMLYDLVEMARLLSSIEVEEDFDAPAMELTELCNGGKIGEPNMDFINKKPSWRKK